MKLKSLSILAMAFSLCYIPMEPAEAGQRKRIRNTQVNQAKRIRHGVNNGSLTRREARRLGRQQKRIRQNRRRAAADGEITKKEAARLRLQQAKASRQIYKQKHDDQTQGGQTQE